MSAFTVSVLIFVCAVAVALGQTKCYNCKGVTNPDDCATFTYCQPNEVCMASTKIVGGGAVHSFGCNSAAQCKSVMEIALRDMNVCYGSDSQDLCGDSGLIGKRQIGICNACCNDDECNDGNCKTLIEHLYVGYKHGEWDLSTLQNTTNSG